MELLAARARTQGFVLRQTGRAGAKRDSPAELWIDVIIFKKKLSGDITGLTLLVEAS